MSPDQTQDSKDIEQATTAILPSPVQPDKKARRYDRQLRLWATSGQAALESARILAISGSATATSILKNLVLPGIGHFTILDPDDVTYEDAGVNFFLEGLSSVGKKRAEEAVRLLKEMNDDVQGEANTSSLEDVLENNPDYLRTFNLIITHNLNAVLLSKLSAFLWSQRHGPTLIVVRSSGFMAEFFIQFHEHTVVDSHSETAPSLRIDKPFPTLLEHSMSLDFQNMDDMEHGHIPYVVILVRAMEEWKKAHGGPPEAYADKQAFKKAIGNLRRKIDEENFDEAVSQAYRAWTTTNVPSDIAALFNDPALNESPSSLPPSSAIFFHLVRALAKFSEQPPHALPLTSTLPDMKSDTKSYIHLQTLYKQQADDEKRIFKSFIGQELAVDEEAVDEFVRNAHGLRLLRGKQFGSLDTDKDALANLVESCPREVAAHLAFAGLAAVQAKAPQVPITSETLIKEVYGMLEETAWTGDAKIALENAVGEIVRAPMADLPNTAAFLGGLVAQEAIKMTTRQYVPVKGYCIVDLVGSCTGMIDG